MVRNAKLDSLFTVIKTISQYPLPRPDLSKDLYSGPTQGGDRDVWILGGGVGNMGKSLDAGGRAVTGLQEFLWACPG